MTSGQAASTQSSLVLLVMYVTACKCILFHTQLHMFVTQPSNAGVLGSTLPTCRRSTRPRLRGCARPLSATLLRRHLSCTRATLRSSAGWQTSCTDSSLAPIQVCLDYKLHVGITRSMCQRYVAVCCTRRHHTDCMCIFQMLETISHTVLV